MLEENKINCYSTPKGNNVFYSLYKEFYKNKGYREKRLLTELKKTIKNENSRDFKS